MAASDSNLATENAERQRLFLEGKSACKASRRLVFTWRINSLVTFYFWSTSNNFKSLMDCTSPYP